MRQTEPSRRWYLRWAREHIAAGGWAGPATIRAVWPLAVEIYRRGGTAAAAGYATADHYRLHSSREGWRELGEAYIESRNAA